MTVTADGAHIEDLLRQRALTRAELAKEAEVNPNTITRMLRGESVRASTYWAVMKALQRHPKQRHVLARAS